MPEDEDLSRHEEVAKAEARDAQGHFIHAEQPKPEPQNPQQPESHQDPVSKFLSDHTHYNKNQDDILDVHIGNPLQKIYQVLLDIKKQKVLSISAKISFGILGVAVAVGIFSIFGVSNVFCAKGVQSEIGVIKTLNVEDKTSSNIPVIGNLIDWFGVRTNPQTHARVVLVRDDNTTIHLPYSKNVKFATYQNLPVIVTGNYDACNSTLTVQDESGVETFRK